MMTRMNDVFGFRRSLKPVAATACLALATGLLSAGSQASAQERSILSGSCHSSSYVAEGPIASDLGQRRTPYFCSDAITVTFDTNGRTLVQFVEKGSSVGVILGFAGVFDSTGRRLLVDRMYLNPSEPRATRDGVCIFTTLPAGGTTIECIGLVDESNRRTIAAVYFGGE